MTADEYRRLALGFPGAIESAHHNHPDFRIGGKIFATIWKDNGVVLLSPDQQSQLVDSHPNIFTPAKGGWGKKGSTTVLLDNADEASVRQALTIAYTNKVSKK